MPRAYILTAHANYMTDDQRFAARRTDVLVYQTDTLSKDITLGGPVVADLLVSLSNTDADFVVKLIDVFPVYLSYNEVDIYAEEDQKGPISDGWIPDAGSGRDNAAANSG